MSCMLLYQHFRSDFIHVHKDPAELIRGAGRGWGAGWRELMIYIPILFGIATDK